MINKEKLKELPNKPGVYLMKDKYEEIIYIGKAINLRNRVRQYFQSSKNHSIKVQKMVANINDFEIIITDSELEALILECNLIKKHRPKYNVMMKDDKSYPFIKITINERYPRVLMTRKALKDDSKYFGPYTSSYSVKQTIDAINKVYPIRMCNKRIEGNKIIGRPCLNFHINQCMGVCQGQVDEKEYGRFIKEIIQILNGKQQKILDLLQIQMQQASENMDYERAAGIRDQIRGIKHIAQKQNMITSTLQDQDVIAFANDENNAFVQVFFIRAGKLIGREQFVMEGTDEMKRKEIMTAFVKQFYSNAPFIPKEILLQEEIDEAQIIHNWLKDKKGTKVFVKIPKKGEKKKLIDLVVNNATLTLEKHKQRISSINNERNEGLSQLKELLSIEKKLERIEAYDISNIRGTDNVGAMIVYENGKLNKKKYRRFKIKHIDGQDDYGSMQEIVFRRLNRGVEELNSGQNNIIGKFLPLPELIMVDGGIGHVNAIKNIINSFNLQIPICGMVKDDNHRIRGLVYQGNEITIQKATSLFTLINRISEEVHRFAISYHKNIRSKNSFSSELEEIKGIGPKRRKELLMHFRSLDAIKKASINDLAKTNGMNKLSAQKVWKYFHEDRKSGN